MSNITPESAGSNGPDGWVDPDQHVFGAEWGELSRRAMRLEGPNFDLFMLDWCSGVDTETAITNAERRALGDAQS